MKKAEKISQQEAAYRIGMTASGFNQYINGKIPLNTDATALLAGFFGVKPREIDPDWLKDPKGGSPTQDELDAEFEDIIQSWSPAQEIVLAQSLADRTSPKNALRIARIFLDRAESGL